MITKKYFDKIGQKYIGSAKFESIVKNLIDVKRSSSKHAGGMMIIPKEYSVYDFTPIQYAANKRGELPTTHFDYHVIHDDIIKLDQLGHDAPTEIKLLKDFTGTDPMVVADLSDKNVLKLFQPINYLNIDWGIDDKYIAVNTNGIPEFNTSFIKQMLYEINPKTMADLIKISGLSHGTNVWIGNLRDVYLDAKATFNEILGARDDIMLYLIDKGLDKKQSFFIMEKVRKGKGLNEEDIKDMRKHNVPEWYIESCNKISYLFPSAQLY